MVPVGCWGGLRPREGLEPGPRLPTPALHQAAQGWRKNASLWGPGAPVVRRPCSLPFGLFMVRFSHNEASDSVYL